MILSCPLCKELIRFNEQERHNERECPERTLNCKYCKEPFHFKNIKVSEWSKIRCDVFEGGKSFLCYKIMFSLTGPWWDLSQISYDLWRMCEEENPQGKGVVIINIDQNHTEHENGYSVTLMIENRTSYMYGWSIISLQFSFGLFSMLTTSSSAANSGLRADIMWLAVTC